MFWRVWISDYHCIFFQISSDDDSSYEAISDDEIRSDDEKASKDENATDDDLRLTSTDEEQVLPYSSTRIARFCTKTEMDPNS